MGVKVFLPITYKLRLPGSRIEFATTVPGDFFSDGVTIPRWLWWFLSPFGDALEGAILHDYILKQGVQWRRSTNLLCQVLKITDCPNWKIPIVWVFVNINGLINHRDNF